jgi:hypothetical protein
LKLAEDKSAEFPGLVNVTLIEDWQYEVLKEWEYPEDLLVAFEVAGIYLRVVLRLGEGPRW